MRPRPIPRLPCDVNPGGSSGGGTGDKGDLAMKGFFVLALLCLAVAAFAGSATATPVSRSNAVRAAHEYLQSGAFSHTSLMSQLEFEGFTATQAAYGVRAVGL